MTCIAFAVTPRSASRCTGRSSPARRGRPHRGCRTRPGRGRGSHPSPGRCSSLTSSVVPPSWCRPRLHDAATRPTASASAIDRIRVTAGQSDGSTVPHARIPRGPRSLCERASSIRAARRRVTKGCGRERRQPASRAVGACRCLGATAVRTSRRNRPVPRPRRSTCSTWRSVIPGLRCCCSCTASPRAASIGSTWRPGWRVGSACARSTSPATASRTSRRGWGYSLAHNTQLLEHYLDHVVGADTAVVVAHGPARRSRSSSPCNGPRGAPRFRSNIWCCRTATSICRCRTSPTSSGSCSTPAPPTACSPRHAGAPRRRSRCRHVHAAAPFADPEIDTLRPRSHTMTV